MKKIICLICKVDTSKIICLYNLMKQKIICCECFNKIEYKKQTMFYKSNKITTLFIYNEVMKKIVHLWKIQKHPLAINCLAELLKNLIPKNSIVLFPPSWKANSELNNIEKLLKKLKINSIDVFQKTYNYQQGKTEFKKRKSSIILSKPIPRKFILIDDIYTSGITIKSVLDILNKKGHKKINVLILATTQRFP